MVYVTHDQLEASTFADKIALMYEGKIVQFGTPRELFENPNHTFVGYFIGSPGMNLLEIEVTAEGAKMGEITVCLNDQQRRLLKSAGNASLKLGIRPEFVQLSSQSNDESMPCTLVHTEDLGTYKIVTVMLGEHSIKVRLDEEQQVPEQNAYLNFPSQWLKFYADDYLIVTDETGDKS